MTFFDDLSAVFDELAVYQWPVLICGDFNVHVDVDNDTHAVHTLYTVTLIVVLPAVVHEQLRDVLSDRSLRRITVAYSDHGLQS